MRVFNCGHPRTPEHLAADGRCKTCASARRKAGNQKLRNKREAIFVGPRLPKGYCLRGHNKAEVGTYPSGGCKKCGGEHNKRLEDKRKAPRQLHEANFVGPVAPHSYCSRGHAVLGVNDYRGRCRLCRSDFARAQYQKEDSIIPARNKKWKESNREKSARGNRAWRQRNPGRWCALVMKSHAARIQRTPTWLTSEQHEQITAYYLYAKLLENAIGEKIDVDHIVPLRGRTVSGLHVPWNLQVLSASKNRSKGNKFSP